jgi:hypothetical protein
VIPGIPWRVEWRGLLVGVASCDDVEMILEQAHLDVIPSQEAAFEAAFAEAKLVISAMPGFRSLRLSRCVERSNRYLLLVEWRRLRGPHRGVPTLAGIRVLACAASSLL